MKKIILSVIAVCILCVMTSCGESRRSYLRGTQAFMEGRYREALEHYRLAVSQGESGDAVYLDMAAAAARAGETAEASEYFQQVAGDSTDSRILKKTGIYFEAIGDYKQALEQYRLSLEAAGKKKTDSELETRGLIGRAEMQLGHYEAALAIYNELIVEGYHPVEHVILAGTCYVNMQQMYAACQYFSLLENRKDVTAIHFGTISNILSEAGDEEDAARYFKLGQDRIGKKKEPMTEGEYYYYTGRIAEAEKLLADSDTLRGRMVRISALIDKKEYDEAEAVCLELIRDGEDLPAVYTRYMSVKILQNDFDSALQLLTQIRSFGDRKALKDAEWNEIMLYEMKLEYKTAYDRLLEYEKTYGSDDMSAREIRFLSAVTN